MSRDRFDVLERLAPLFEAPEAPFEGFARRRDRKRRNQRVTAGVVGIAVFVAAVWIVTTGGPFDRTLTPATTEPTGPTGPPHPTGVGLLGLPPEGATASTPERGELVLGVGFGHTGGDPGRFSLHLYADGRVIWQRLGDFRGDANVPSTGLIEQRLTAEGVELVLAEALSTATPEQVRALERLDARLEDLASWLPASAWEDPEFRAYVPSRYSVCYMGQDEPLGRPRILDLLPAAAGDLLRARDTTRSAVMVDPRGGTIPFWCSVVTTEEARVLAEILKDAGADKSPYGPGYTLWPSDGGEVVNIDFGAVLPHER